MIAAAVTLPQPPEEDPPEEHLLAHADRARRPEAEEPFPDRLGGREAERRDERPGQGARRKSCRQAEESRADAAPERAPPALAAEADLARRSQVEPPPRRGNPHHEQDLEHTVVHAREAELSARDPGQPPGHPGARDRRQHEDADDQPEETERPHALGRVLGVEAHVGQGEIRRDDASLAPPEMEIEDDPHLAPPHARTRLAERAGKRAPTPRHRYAADRDVDPLLVDRHPRVPRRHHEAPPVRVAAVERGLAEHGVTDCSRHPTRS